MISRNPLLSLSSYILMKAVQQLRRLVAGLTLLTSLFAPGLVHGGRSCTGTVFFSKFFGFSLSALFHLGSPTHINWEINNRHVQTHSLTTSTRTLTTCFLIIWCTAFLSRPSLAFFIHFQVCDKDPVTSDILGLTL